MTSAQDSGIASRVAIIGASGAIGAALVRLFSGDPQQHVFALSRSGTNFQQANVTQLHIDTLDEPGIVSAVRKVAENGPVDRVLLATGLLHDAGQLPDDCNRKVASRKQWRLASLGRAGDSVLDRDR